MSARTSSPVTRQLEPAPQLLQVAMRATEINTDPSCDKTIDPDTALWHCSCLEVTMVLCGYITTKICMDPVTVWPLDVNMPSGGCPDWSIHMLFSANTDHDYHHRPRVGQWTKTRSSAATWALIFAWQCRSLQISITLVAACLLDISMASGGSAYYDHLYDLLWYHKPWTSTQTLPAVGPEIQTWLLAAAWAWMSPWPWEQHRSLRLAWPQQQDGHQRTWPQMLAQTMITYLPFIDNKGHGHQHRPQLW